MLIGYGLALAVLIIGVLIGSVGVGGVLLVPSLVYAGGIPLKEAIPASMLAYLATGIVGTLMYARMGSVNWQQLWWLVAGALPGAYIGAYLLPLVPGAVLEFCIGSLVALSGVHALIKNKQGDEHFELPNRSLTLIGFLVGTGSALTGTGGPLLLIPVLMWMNMPVLWR